MEGNGSRMPSGEMGEERREVEKGVTEKGKEGVEEEEREGEEAEEKEGEEKGRGGRGLRLLVCTLMTVRKRKKHQLRNREVGEGLEFYLMSVCLSHSVIVQGYFLCVWVPFISWSCFCDALQCD